MAKTLEPGVHIYTPFFELTKEEVIERGRILGVVSDLKPALSLWRASATPANSRTPYAQNFTCTSRSRQIPELTHPLCVIQEFAETYSCMKGVTKHCGTCKQCADRRRAFVQAGAPEPPEFYER